MLNLSIIEIDLKKGTGPMYEKTTIFKVSSSNLVRVTSKRVGHFDQDSWS